MMCRKVVPGSKTCTVVLTLLHLVIIFGIFRYPYFTYQSDIEDSWNIQTQQYHDDNDVKRIGNLVDQSLLKNPCPGLPSIPDVSPIINLWNEPPGLEEIREKNPQVLKGGEWKPHGCTPRQKIAVIIPYRDRWQHLLYLLDRLHPMLQRQQCHYRIFVSEQANGGLFNKGRVMNSGFFMASQLEKWDCFVFHDVDLIPETDLNLYRCAENPLHLSAGVDQLRYTLMYNGLVGGVLALTKEQFEKANGFSNDFWGWGGEDDNMYHRIIQAGMDVLHTSTQRGRYKMVPHGKRKPSQQRIKLLASPESWKFDGLTNLQNIDLRILSVTSGDLYTNISVDTGKAPQLPPESKPSFWNWIKSEFWVMLFGY